MTSDSEIKRKKYRGNHRSHVRGVGGQIEYDYRPTPGGSRRLLISARRAQEYHELQINRNHE